MACSSSILTTSVTKVNCFACILKRFEAVSFSDDQTASKRLSREAGIAQW